MRVNSGDTGVRKRAHGFTFVEAVVVVVLIVALANIALPCLARAANKSQSVRCVFNLRRIIDGASLYAEANEGYFHFRTLQGYFAPPNHGKWTRNPRSTNELDLNDEEAYWGIAYRPYTRGTKELWSCPSARTVDDWRDDGLSFPMSFWLNSTYGLNELAVIRSGNGIREPHRTSDFESPATTIFAQDAAEQKMEGRGDSLGLFPGDYEILTQWRNSFGGHALYPGIKMEYEWFRHPTCNTVWIDGHVSLINYTLRGVDYRFYTGEAKPKN